ncbi:NAD(P)-dependent oxidoreductase [Schleiferilactobacillus shenzhenensis]|uniref:NAD(P)-dependent oxidoreductase n=1 Tax=Schleiferilactobacillus shenzhenensis TaxID=1231337 RepID=UPI0005906FB0|nr:NAD(P)H-binding protein [Schleiferilactobacillus shenzhenensis]
MNITVIGATGMAGSAIVQEAVKRGHTVTAMARSENDLAALAKKVAGIHTMAVDAFQVPAEDWHAADAVVDAFATDPAHAYLHIDLATRLVAELRGTNKPRVVFILGAGSLQTGADHHLVVDDLRKLPGSDQFIAIPESQYIELQFLRSVKNVNWVGISPSRDFTAGPATKVLMGTNTLLHNAAGQSHTTAGTMAVAVLDEIEQPQHRQTRFTVADK